jgi:hypothetical protein
MHVRTLLASGTLAIVGAMAAASCGSSGAAGTKGPDASMPEPGGPDAQGTHPGDDGGTISGDDGPGSAVVGTNEGGADGGSDAVVPETCRDGGAGTWDTSALRIDGDQTHSAHAPQIGVDRLGNATAVYEEQDLPTDSYTIWATRRPAGGSFQQPVAVSPIGAVAADTPPVLAVSADGTAIALWPQPFTRIHSSHYAPGQGWTSEAELNVDAGANEQSSDPAIAMDSNGNGVAVWTESTGSSAGTPDYAFQVYARPYVASTGWGDAIRLSTYGAPVPGTPYATASATSVSVAVDDAGDAVVAWEVGLTPTSSGQFIAAVQMIRYDGAMKSWGPPAAFEFDNALATQVVAGSTSAAVDAQGNALVVWAGQGPGDGGTGNSLVWSARSARTPGTWSAPQSISPIIPFEAGAFVLDQVADPIVAYDGAGNALAVWRMGTGAIANRFAGGSWQTAVMLTPNQNDSNSGGPPSLAFDALGNAVSIWQGHSTMQSARFDVSKGAWDPTVDLQGGEAPQIAMLPGSCGGPLAVFFVSTGVYAVGQH